MGSWFVYILKCADGTFYIGTTTDLVRRVAEHNAGKAGKGAKYTTTRRPVVLVYQEAQADRSSAQIREAALKKLSRIQKQHLIDNL